jgi:putative SOS response-associated peptidase YedK
MCNRYHPACREIDWEEFRAMPPENLPVGPTFPRKPGPFIRAGADGERQVAVGQWGLIPWFAKELPLKYSSNNARIETAPTAGTTPSTQSTTGSASPTGSLRRSLSRTAPP